jgi:hypothetical protein
VGVFLCNKATPVSKHSKNKTLILEAPHKALAVVLDQKKAF